MKTNFNMNTNFNGKLLIFAKNFNRSNFSRAIVIFLVGFASRFLVNFFTGINGFTEYTNPISLTYYGIFAVFASYIELLDFLSYIVFKFICFIFKMIFNFELKEFISNIADTINAMKNNDKITVGRNLNSNSSDNSNIDFTYDGMKKNDKITIVINLNNNSSDNSNIDDTYDDMKNYDKLAIGTNGLAIRDNDSNIWNGKDLNIMKMNNSWKLNSSNNTNLEGNENLNPQPQQLDLSDSISESPTVKKVDEFFNNIDDNNLEVRRRSEDLENDIPKHYANCETKEQASALHDEFNKIIKSNASRIIEETREDAAITKSVVDNSENYIEEDKKYLKDLISDSTKKIIEDQGRVIGILGDLNDSELNKKNDELD